MLRPGGNTVMFQVGVIPLGQFVLETRACARRRRHQGNPMVGGETLREPSAGCGASSRPIPACSLASRIHHAAIVHVTAA